MTENAQESVRPPRTPLEDARLVPFENAANCDINAMRDAVRLVHRDPAILQTISQVFPSQSDRIDFSHPTGERGRQTPRDPNGADSHEWASALIAATQIAYERGLRLQDVPANDIITRGDAVYDDMQARFARARARGRQQNH